MISFKVVETTHKIGPKKGQKAFNAVPKAPMKFSADWLVNRIVRETSLSEGDVRNVIITLRNIAIEVISLGGSLDLGDLFSFRVAIPSKLIDDVKEVSAESLKRPRILVRWKSAVTDALKKIEVDVDNPARKKGKKPESPSPSPKEKESEGPVEDKASPSPSEGGMCLTGKNGE